MSRKTLIRTVGRVDASRSPGAAPRPLLLAAFGLGAGITVVAGVHAAGAAVKVATGHRTSLLPLVEFVVVLALSVGAGLGADSFLSVLTRRWNVWREGRRR